ncbi:kinase-like domain-containing protein [Rhizophagus diaphanus]|nr:kinase-like domain-containing protein [Rhizophagus diaphanus] [Rhizophagus sp. MUCL 43196]
MMIVALKRLIGSHNISDKYFSKLKIHWEVCMLYGFDFYGLTKDPETNEFIMIIRFADKGSLRSSLSKNFNDMNWQNKINLLHKLSYDLQNFHKLGYFHGQFHSLNILQDHNLFFISDFGLNGSANIDKGIYGIIPFVAPEVFNGEPYTISSDIYSFGAVMTELSTGKPPFYNKEHDDENLIFAIAVVGLRPEFGKETPKFYEKLVYKCMNKNPNERPTAEELFDIFNFWLDSIRGRKDEEECFSYKGREIKDAFKEADKEIPNISTSYKKVF